jgi:hypothetical protein
MLDQLHTLIRHPFEILRDYCEDYDAAMKPGIALKAQLEIRPWYTFTRLIRNAISHNYRFEFSTADIKRLPVTWGPTTLTVDLNGQPMTYEMWHKPGYALFVEMRAFAKSLPEP